MRQYTINFKMLHTFGIQQLPVGQGIIRNGHAESRQWPAARYQVVGQDDFIDLAESDLQVIVHFVRAALDSAKVRRAIIQ